MTLAMTYPVRMKKVNQRIYLRVWVYKIDENPCTGTLPVPNSHSGVGMSHSRGSTTESTRKFSGKKTGKSDRRRPTMPHTIYCPGHRRYSTIVI